MPKATQLYGLIPVDYDTSPQLIFSLPVHCPPRCLPSSPHSPAPGTPPQGSALMEMEEIDREHSKSSTRWEGRNPMNGGPARNSGNTWGKGQLPYGNEGGPHRRGTFELGPRGQLSCQGGVDFLMLTDPPLSQWNSLPPHQPPHSAPPAQKGGGGGDAHRGRGRGGGEGRGSPLGL